MLFLCGVEVTEFVDVRDDVGEDGGVTCDECECAELPQREDFLGGDGSVARAVELDGVGDDQHTAGQRDEGVLTDEHLQRQRQDPALDVLIGQRQRS